MSWQILNMADVGEFPDVLDCLRSVAEVVSLPADRDALLQRIPEVDGYFCSLAVRVDRDVLARAKRLRAIATPSTGLDHIDMEAVARRHIHVISLKEETAFLDQVTATAEMAWCLLLAVMRRLPWSFEAARAGVWARDRFRGHQLAGMTLGILGYGRLGRMVAEYGKAFRMRVLACDVRPVASAPGVEMVAYERLLRESDVLSIHIHLTDANRGLIGRDAFAMMKPGAVLINTSRGAIVDETALLEALATGRLGGAGVDVIDGEWNADLSQHPVIRYAGGHENLVISPHTGGVTYESQRLAYAYTAQKLRHFIDAAE